MPSRMPKEVIKFFKRNGKKAGLVAKQKGVDYRKLQKKSVKKRLENKALREKELSTVALDK